MMDEQTHLDGEQELALDTEGDDATVTVANDTDGQEIEPTAEREQDALDLGDKPKEEGKAITARDRQVDAWAAKIASGEKSLDDLPPNLKWIRSHVEAKLGTKAPDVRETVAQAIKAEREQIRFNDLQEDCKELSKDKREALQDKFKVFRAKGLSQLDALETSMLALNIDPEQDRVDARRQAARLRTPGRFKAPGKDATPEAIHGEGGYAEVAKNIPEAKRLEYLKSLRNMR